jgi:hypothetical protein
MDEIDAVDRLELEDVEGEDRALERAGLVGARGRTAPELSPHVLAPRAGHGPEVDDELARPQEVQLHVDLLQLVGGARAVAVALRLLDVRVGQVVVQPRLVQLLALLRRRHNLAIPRSIIGG